MPSPRWAVVPYRPEWPDAFGREQAQLREVFAGTRLQIEHVGSTAVPGLGAKAIIDIMAGVDDLSDVTSRIEALRQLGYSYVPEYEAELPDRRYFRKPAERPRTHHLHVVLKGSVFWTDHLKFRDHLRKNPDVARSYHELKARLAKECSETGADYATSKSAFIQSVLASVPRG